MVPQIHWLLVYGAGLTTLEERKFRSNSSQDWTPYDSRVCTLGIQAQLSTGYPVGHIPVHIPFAYTPFERCTLLNTQWPVLKDYVTSIFNHAYTWDVTAPSDVTLAVLEHYITHGHYRAYINGTTLRDTILKNQDSRKHCMGSSTAENVQDRTQGLKVCHASFTYRPIQHPFLQVLANM